MKDDDHHLYKRGKIFWMCIIVRGKNAAKRIRVSLRTTDLRRAMRERDRYIEPIRSTVIARKLQRLAGAIEKNEMDSIIASNLTTEKKTKSEVAVNDLIERFVKSRDNKGTSAKSIDSYVRLISAMRSFLAPRGILDAVRDDWRGFVDKIQLCPKEKWFVSGKIVSEKDPEKRLKDKTVSNILNGVLSFYKWLEKEQIMDRSPFTSVETVAIRDSTQRCAPPPDIACKLRDIEPPEGCGIDKEEWVLFIGLISRTGMRRGECASLEIGKLSLNDDIPWFLSRNEKQGKGQTNRAEKAIPVPASCLEMLRRLASARKSERYLFSTVGHISGTSKLGIPFEEFGVKIGKTWNKIAKKVWPRMDLHTWRHYCSIHVNRRFPQEVAMRLLGHSPGFRAINEIYNERNLEQLRDAVNSIP